MENRSPRETLVGYYKRGLTRMKMKNYEAAIPDLVAATRVELLKTEPILVEAWEHLGIAYFETQQLCNAKQALDKAIALNRETTENNAPESTKYLRKIAVQNQNPCK
jgi:tetratricopeptide (TPR) repeat protein